MSNPTLCPIHGSPLLCPRCMAAKGGQSRSRKKLKAVKETIAGVNESLTEADRRKAARRGVRTRRKNSIDQKGDS